MPNPFLENSDRIRLTSILAHRPEFTDEGERGRRVFIRHAGLEEFLGQVDLNGEPGVVAGDVVGRLEDYGRLSSEPKHHALWLLVEYLIGQSNLSDDNREFLSKMNDRYGLERPRPIDPDKVTLPLLKIERPIYLELVRIPAGPFLMGYDKRPVDVAEFYIGKYPITNDQYAAFVKQKNYYRPSHWKLGRIPKGKENHPVVLVSWDDATVFCDWLSQNTDTGLTFRLPTEEEWEKAARGGIRIPDPGGNKLIDNPWPDREYPWGKYWNEGSCNSKGSRNEGTTPVEKYSPAGDSPYHVADMAGNVWEWCQNEYGDHLYSTILREPRVIRGGHWNLDVRGTTISYADELGADHRVHFVGFRVCAVIPQE